MPSPYLSLDYLNSGASRTFNDDAPLYTLNGMITGEEESIYEREGYNTQMDQQDVRGGLETPAYTPITDGVTGGATEKIENFDFLKDGIIDPVDTSYYEPPKPATYWTTNRIIGVTLILVAILSFINKVNKSEEVLANFSRAFQPFIVHILLIAFGAYLVK